MGYKETLDGIVEDGEIFKRFVKGLDTETIATEGGPIPSIAKFIKDLTTNFLRLFNATSTSDVAVGLGEKTFQIEAGKGYAFGQWLNVAASGKSMAGTVVSYANTTLVINVVHVTGTGNAANWAISITGPAGRDGEDGDDGFDAVGTNGKSTYELAVESGYTGTLSEWLLTLKGASAYQLAVQAGFTGSLSQWLDSLKGSPGTGGGGSSTRLITKFPWDLQTAPID